jgi:hypothetical protein
LDGGIKNNGGHHDFQDNDSFLRRTLLSMVAKEEELLKMGNGKAIWVVGFLTLLITFSLLVKATEAEAGVYYGRVVGTEFFVLQVKGDNGGISVFWLGHRTHLNSRPPWWGDKVKIEYVKDGLGRNAVTRIALLK